MRLEPKDRTVDRVAEERVIELLREFNGTGHTCVYSKTHNFYKYLANVDTEVMQYRISVTHPYRSAIMIELIGNNLKHILAELEEWTSTT